MAKPIQDRRIPNVVGREHDLQALCSALYPYRDYPEVRAELDRYRQERIGQSGKTDPE